MNIDEEKFQRIFAWCFRALLVLSSTISFFNADWLNTFIAVLTLFLTFLPFMIAKKNKIHLPASYQILILSFIFAAQYLGEIKTFYYRFWWWDLMLHTFSGIALGLIGVLLIYILNNEKRVNVILSPFFRALFAFTFAVAVGALWEIFEFSVDNILGANMQKTGLVDTMWDLIVDAIGAAISAICGFFYSRKKGKVLFNRLVNEFLDDNEDFFTQKNTKEIKQ